MDPGSAAHRKSAAQRPGNAFFIPGMNAIAFTLGSIATQYVSKDGDNH